MRKAVQRSLRSKTTIIYEEPTDVDTDRNYRYLRSLYKLLDCADEDSYALLSDVAPEERVQTEALKKRIAARERLCKLLSASRFEDDRIVEYRVFCPFGAFDSVAEAHEAVEQSVQTAHLDMHTTVPAVNRWTKLFQPLAYWTVGTRVGYLPDSFVQICEPRDDVADVLTESDIYGVGGEDSYMRRRQKRFKKSSTWLSAETTPLFQTTSCIILLKLVLLMGLFFKHARFDDTGEKSIVDFCIDSRSPAVKLLLNLFGLLSNEDDEFWLPVSGTSGWTRRKYTVASTLMMRTLASVVYRFILAFKKFPWALAVAANNEVPMAERLVIIYQFIHCDPECYEPGVGMPIRSVVNDADDLKNDEALKRVVMSALKNVPLDNIQNEDRFARQHVQSSTCHGKLPSNTTICARHVNSELQAWHGIAIDAMHEREARAAKAHEDHVATLPKTQKHYKDAYHKFVAQHMPSVKHMNVIADMWQRASPEERAVFETDAPTEGDEDPSPDPPALTPEAEVQAQTPWQAGTRCYPITPELAREATVDLPTRAREWQRLVGTLVRPRADIVMKNFRDHNQCCDKYGMGRCHKDFTEDHKRALAFHKRAIWALTKLELDVEDQLTLIPVHVMRKVQAAGHEPVERVFMVPLTLCDPEPTQMYLDLETDDVTSADGSVVSGITLKLGLSKESFHVETDMAIWMLAHQQVNFLRARYHFTGLDRMVVCGMEDVTGQVHALMHGDVLDQELALIRALAKSNSKERRAKTVPARRREDEAAGPDVASESGASRTKK